MTMMNARDVYDLAKQALVYVSACPDYEEFQLVGKIASRTETINFLADLIANAEKVANAIDPLKDGE